MGTCNTISVNEGYNVTFGVFNATISDGPYLTFWKINYSGVSFFSNIRSIIGRTIVYDNDVHFVPWVILSLY